MRLLLLFTFCSYCFPATGQVDFETPFKNCKVNGSSTIYDYNNHNWIMTDSVDAAKETLPASTFKVINLLIALQTGVVKDENAMVKWVGQTDTSLYGYRPDIYRDMTVKQAFELSAGWVFLELAKKVGKERYTHYLKLCGYGNLNLSEPGTDFWNVGSFSISPINQVNFLVKIYKNQLPFSKRNLSILKKVMITETTNACTIRSKTGWTKWDGNDTGWWVGYVTTKNNVYFFATRITKKRTDINPNFGECRKDITKSILRQLHAIE